MGGLTLAVRDENSEVNLWDFMGLPIGLLYDRDSTSLDLWVDHRMRKLDLTRGGIEREVDRGSGTDIASETIIRSGRKLAVGTGLGHVGIARALPFSDGVYTNDEISLPVIAPVATGNFGSRVAWGLRGVVGRETLDRNWWADHNKGGKIELDRSGEQVPPPNFFAPDHSQITVGGIGVSLGYRHPRWGEGAVFFDYRRDRLQHAQVATRHIFELEEPRDVKRFGAAATIRPRSRVEVGAAVGRELFDSKENYRFTLSGGSIDPPLTARGDRVLRNVRREFFRLRGQADLDPLPVTVGAAMRVAYDRTNESAPRGHTSDFNVFALNIASDTLAAPPLVEDQRQAVRTIELGGGVSTHLLERRATVGAELRWFRDAIEGTDRLRRQQGWEARAGGEVKVTHRWAGLAGIRHRKEDQDRFTPRNEFLTDRLTLGVRREGFMKLNLQAYGYHEWRRTDYPDPREWGGSATGFGLLASREF